MSGTNTISMERGFRNYIRDYLTGCDIVPQVIPGNDPGPRPDGQYVTVLLVRTERIGTSEHSPDGRIRVWKRTNFSVQFWRTGSRFLADGFVFWHTSPIGRRSEGAYRFSIRVPSPPVRLDEVYVDSFEERVALNVDVDWLDEQRQELGEIKTATIGINMDGVCPEPVHVPCLAGARFGIVEVRAVAGKPFAYTTFGNVEVRAIASTMAMM